MTRKLAAAQPPQAFSKLRLVCPGFAGTDQPFTSEALLSSREDVLARIRASVAATATPAALPDVDPAALVRAGSNGSGWPRFAARLTEMKGRPFDSVEELGKWLISQGRLFGFCESHLKDRLAEELPSGLWIETEFDRSRIDEYQFAMTEAHGAIAETGSVILSDLLPTRRLATLAPWVHVAVIRPGTILETVSDALAAMPDSNYVIWCTGPSKTGDIEDILIQGVHGPGEQAVLLLSD